MKKIAILGKANSGKNTVAEMLVKHSGLNKYNSKIVAMADPLKFAVKAVFPEASDRCLFGPSEARSEIIDKKYKDADGNALTHRKALIDLGRFARAYCDHIFLDALIKSADDSKDCELFIIPDCRFLIEFNHLKKSGFQIIRVLRETYTLIDDNSETEQDAIRDEDCDFVINNDSTIDDLSNIIKSIIPKFK